MDKISIVVPVYKVEKYLERCVNSILSQTYTNIEVILVDDGSPDKCPEMCEQLEQKDDRIVVVHKKNGGLSSARNVGLVKATGKYIGFVDSDDTVEPNMYEELYKKIKKYNCDFVMSDYKRVLADGSEYLKSLEITNGYYNKKSITETIYPELIMGKNLDYGPLLSVWHCMYDLEFLRKNKIMFDEEVQWSEDNIFSAIVGYYADSFYYLKGEGLYHYYQNPGTITTSYKKGAWEVYKKMNEHLKEFFQGKTGAHFDEQLQEHLVYYACVCIGQTNMLSKKQRNEELRKILNDNKLQDALKHINLKKFPKKLAIQLSLMKYKSYKLMEVLIIRRK